MRPARASSHRRPTSTRPPPADMLESARRVRKTRSMSAQREFSDGEVVPGTRYRVTTLVGMGGMGSVYEVEHCELGKRFVLKALLRSLADRDDLGVRLRNEWRALGRLEHQNIVSVTDAGVTSTGVPYYVMERLLGETLATRLRREVRLPLVDALRIASEVLEGLSAAHRIGVVHRDVKPPNIFLVTGRQTKLLDFGIAKVLDPKASQITGRGITLGTPRYMAPEQATGDPIDARTDLYAAGLILYEMISGAGPFDTARDANELFLAHVAREPPSLIASFPEVPLALEQLVKRLLAKRVEERPSDASVVAGELRALRDQIVARPSVRDRAPDATSPGGPFDTIERAVTQPTPNSRRPLGRSEAPTHTSVGLGPTDTVQSNPPSLASPDSVATESERALSAAAPSSGERSQTLRLDGYDDAPDTHTAVPSLQPETPPPVAHEEGNQGRPARRLLRWPVLLLAAAALAVPAMLALRTGNGASPNAAAHVAALPAAAPAAVEPVAPTSGPAAAGPEALAASATPEPVEAPVGAAAPAPDGVEHAGFVVQNPAHPAGAGTSKPRPSSGTGAVSTAPAGSTPHETVATRRSKSSGKHGVLLGEALPSSGL